MSERNTITVFFYVDYKGAKEVFRPLLIQYKRDIVSIVPPDRYESYTFVAYEIKSDSLLLPELRLRYHVHVDDNDDLVVYENNWENLR